MEYFWSLRQCTIYSREVWTCGLQRGVLPENDAACDWLGGQEVGRLPQLSLAVDTTRFVRALHVETRGSFWYTDVQRYSRFLRDQRRVRRHSAELRKLEPTEEIWTTHVPWMPHLESHLWRSYTQLRHTICSFAAPRSRQSNTE